MNREFLDRNNSIIASNPNCVHDPMHFFPTFMVPCICRRFFFYFPTLPHLLSNDKYNRWHIQGANLIRLIDHFLVVLIDFVQLFESNIVRIYAVFRRPVSVLLELL